MWQKYGYKAIEYLLKLYGPIILVIVAMGYYGWVQYQERLENQKFYREQQQQWYMASEAHSEKMATKYAEVVDKNSETMKDTGEVLNNLKTSVNILSERLR